MRRIDILFPSIKRVRVSLPQLFIIQYSLNFPTRKVLKNLDISRKINIKIQTTASKYDIIVSTKKLQKEVLSVETIITEKIYKEQEKMLLFFVFLKNLM